MKTDHPYRTRRCGSLRSADVGREVRVAGWVHRVRNFGGLLFVDLRDRFGLVQVIVDPAAAPEAHAAAERARNEWVVSVAGRVAARGAENVNPKLPTGEVEVRAEALEVLARSEAVPLQISGMQEASEEQRLRYRYLDLRRPEMQERLVLRARAAAAVRTVLEERGFLEIETPVLCRSTPEGARDYVVPSRVSRGAFYALPQSPQIFKQLLMVSGFDRYYQVARCFRDEDLRADRQPEFTQIDLEMSFVTEDDVMDVVESVIVRLGELAGWSLPRPFPRFPWSEAMARFGTDSPVVRAIALPGGAKVSRKRLDQLTARAKDLGARGLVWLKRGAEGTTGPSAKFLGDRAAALASGAGAEEGDLALFVADRERVAASVLGALRVELARSEGWIPSDTHAACWVTDFPLVEWDEDAKRWDACHHPFTSPQEQDLPLLGEDPGKVRARAYDVVLDGTEVGGGSIRIHRPDVQSAVFEAIGLDEARAREKFGFLLDAFRFGAPPHGGLALGFDRLVAILAGVDSIREVIAFPKTTSAADLMMGAPAAIDAEQLQDLGIRSVSESSDSKQKS
jgi:aspartyl-tRNA synthetase